MKKLINILIIIVLTTFVGCKAQPQHSEPIKDLETGLFCELPDSNTYQFEAFMIEDFIYDTVYKQYIIDYTDESAEGYIQIECDKKDFFDVLTFYSDEYNYTWVDNYLIKEVFTAVEGGVNIRYYLVRKE